MLFLPRIGRGLKRVGSLGLGRGFSVIESLLRSFCSGVGSGLYGGGIGSRFGGGGLGRGLGGSEGLLGRLRCLLGGGIGDGAWW